MSHRKRGAESAPSLWRASVRTGLIGTGLWLAISLAVAAAPEAVSTSPSADSGATVLPAETWVASRGGASLTLEEIDARLAQMAPELRAGYMNDPERIQMLITNLLLEKQLAELGREAGLHEKPLFDVQVRQVVDRMLGSLALDHHVETAALPDFDQIALERYMADPTLFSVPEQIDVTQILVKTDGRGEDAARLRAEEARVKALAGEVPFEELVREYNEGNPGNGRLPAITRGKTVPAFEEAAFALKEPGDISDVVETRFGFHLIRLEKRIPGSRVPFDAVREKLVKQLREEHGARVGRNLRERLNNMEIEADPQAVASLRTRYMPENTPLKDYAGPASAGE